MTRTFHLILLLTLAAILIHGVAPADAWAQETDTQTSPSLLLEKGIYQEQTVGDLDAAIKCYQQVIDKIKSDRNVAAQAQYRLIQCYLKKNDQTQARKALDELLNTYPDQKELIKDARKQFPDLLKIGKVPWADREKMTLKLITRTGKEVGVIIYTAKQMTPQGGFGMPESENKGGFDMPKAYWKIESHTSIQFNNMIQYTRVDADPTSFAPSYARTINTLMGDFAADYQPNQVKLRMTGSGKTVESEHALSGPVFDNEQAIYLIRRLPLADQYEVTFPIFALQGGQQVDCQIKVIGKETIKCNQGDLPCWKVQLKVLSQGVTALTHTLWFSADKHQWLVKYDTGAVVMLLDDVSIMPKHSVRFDVSEGVTLLQPDGWHFYNKPTSGPPNVNIQLLSPSGSWAKLMTAKNQNSQRSLREIVNSGVKNVESYFSDYLVNDKSWQKRSINGVEALSCTATYTDKGVSKMEYRTYLVHDSRVMWFFFRVDADRFEASKPVYDQIVESLKIMASSAAIQEHPSVLFTTPVALDNQVDPAIKALTVTFSHPMVDKSWSWTGGGKTFPEIDGEIAYDAKQTTCTLPVKLTPGTVYWVGINSPSHKNFQSVNGQSAHRYVILFATRDVDGKPTVIPKDMLQRAKAINDATANKHQLINWVEKFFSENFRDIVGRKKLQWGVPEKSNDGTLSIRYKYQATFKDKQKMIMDQQFVFSPEGKFLSVETIEKSTVTPSGDD